MRRFLLRTAITWLKCTTCIVTLGLFVSASAANVELSWNANSEPDLLGYKIHYGDATGDYQYTIVVGNVTQYAIQGLVGGQTYHFALTAYNRNGKESGYSADTTAVIGQGAGDEVDSDNDGLSDAEESALGTDRNMRDTDQDGVLDGQEVIDNTNPLDRGSAVQTLNSTVCTEWNGFLDNLWNILELVNNNSDAIQAQVTLYDIEGHASGYSSVSIPGHQQRDLLIHDDQAREANSYGLVCVHHDGGTGGLGGRMVYYRQAEGANSSEFQFAFALPLTNGTTGSQFVTFNTYQPSFALEDSLNFVANWIQVTNVGNASVSGMLVYYGQQGETLGEDWISIGPRQRVDLAAHRFGTNRVGIVRWRPDQTTVPCIVRNVRYLYDNPWGYNSFATAFQIDAAPGSSEQIAAPFDTDGETAVLEVANTSSEEQNIAVTLYSSSGAQAAHLNLALSAFESQHIVLNDTVSFSGKGLAVVQGTETEGVLAVAMQYDRAATGKINFMYGMPAREPHGMVLHGSYNTYLGQDSELIVENITGEAQTIMLGVVRQDGTELLLGQAVSVGAHSVSSVTVNSVESLEEYGTVTIHAEHSGAILAAIIRRRGAEYAIPTPF